MDLKLKSDFRNASSARFSAGRSAGVIAAAGHVPEDLFDDALLALGSAGQQLAQLAGAGEIRIRHAGHPGGGIEIQQYFFGFGPAGGHTMTAGKNSSFCCSRRTPMASYFSRPKPIGSIRL